MNIYNELKEIVLPYLKGNVGFSISGGLDSATLLWCCCKIREEENLDCDFTAFTVKRGDNSEEHSINIVNYIRTAFNIELPHEWVGDPNQPHNLQAWSGISEAMERCDHLLIGDTGIPDELQQEWAPKRLRAPGNCVQPMFDWYKDKTVALAIEKGLTDIMKISHSCTESQDIRCGKCWQCGERIWAFEQNNYKDPGNL